MRFCLLASGSKGNSTFIEAPGARILVDVGLSARAMAERLAIIGVEPESIDAVVITHEHVDHVRGLDVWCRRFGTPVYATAATHEAFAASIRPHVSVTHYVPGKALELGSIRLTPFQVSHDAADPVGFLIENGVARLGLATDLGCATALVRERFHGLDALIIEANHDERMLMDGPYPWPVKDRIRRNHGHLSNIQSAKLVAEVAHKGLKTVALAHLSEINNLPSLALRAASDALTKRCSASVTVGTQNKPGDCIAL